MTRTSVSAAGAALVGSWVPSGPPQRDDAEAALLARLKAGHEDAYEALVRLAGGRMLAIARRMLGREEEAQDAVQEAFLSAFRALESFDGRSRLTTWLHRITVNVCLMSLRTRRRHPELSIDHLLPTFGDDGHHASAVRAWRPDPSARIDQAELCELVRSQIDRLDEPYREVLILREIEQLDTRETAQLLGLTTAAVKTRLHRARQALRTLLDPHMVELVG